MEVLKRDAGLQRWVEKIGALEFDPYSASDQVIHPIRKDRGRKVGQLTGTPFWSGSVKLEASGEPPNLWIETEGQIWISGFRKTN